MDLTVVSVQLYSERKLGEEEVVTTSPHLHSEPDPTTALSETNPSYAMICSRLLAQCDRLLLPVVRASPLIAGQRALAGKLQLTPIKLWETQNNVRPQLAKCEPSSL